MAERGFGQEGEGRGEGRGKGEEREGGVGGGRANFMICSIK